MWQTQDTSCKFYEKKDTGIAYKIVNNGEHKGIILSNKLKRELDYKINTHKNYAKLYAICIFYLIKDNLDDFDILVICGDEHFNKVRKNLDILFYGNKQYQIKEIISIGELRNITGNNKLKSYADNISNIYRKKGFKSLQRRQKGIKLNIISLSYNLLINRWCILEDEVKSKM